MKERWFEIQLRCLLSFPSRAFVSFVVLIC
jgi:hypothetical protein